MRIKIDIREREIISCVQKFQPSVTDLLEIEYVPLPLGDIIICDEEEELLIIERKTLQDLAASIKDGRYEEQSYRLN